MQIDIIVPVSVVDYEFFEDNIKVWLREIPYARNKYAGITEGITEQKAINILEKYGFTIVPMNYKTVGKKLSVLIDLVHTDWFAYFHVDARPTLFSMKVIEEFMTYSHIGIIESERIHFHGKDKYSYDRYHFNPRAFSGFQVFRKKAIVSILETIEDDYMERNEDMIFQNVCTRNGYTYEKSFAMHIHQGTTTDKWVFSRKETFDKQWRGLVKYTDPTVITIKETRAAIGACMAWNGLTIEGIIDFINEVNVKWQVICEKL